MQAQALISALAAPMAHVALAQVQGYLYLTYELMF